MSEYKAFYFAGRVEIRFIENNNNNGWGNLAETLERPWYDLDEDYKYDEDLEFRKEIEERVKYLNESLNSLNNEKAYKIVKEVYGNEKKGIWASNAYNCLMNDALKVGGKKPSGDSWSMTMAAFEKLEFGYVITELPNYLQGLI